MQRLKAAVLVLSLALGSTSLAVHAAPGAGTSVQVQQVRNATLKVSYAGKTFLVDPFLAPKGKYPGFKGTFNSQLRNPLVDLPMPAEDVVKGVDAVIVSHTHLDHWDGGDHAFIPKAMPLFVQNDADAKRIRAQGYTNVRILGEGTLFEGVRLSQTGGQHGTDQMYAKPALATGLGKAMGIVFQAPGAKTIYVAGDTVWRAEVDQALAKYKPEVIVLNAGDGRFVGFTGAIIMGADDVLHAYQAMPGATVVATHLDALNHMTLSRKALAEFVKQHGIEDRVRIPADGEVLSF